jgi:hypothetical protein
MPRSGVHQTRAAFLIPKGRTGTYQCYSPSKRQRDIRLEIVPVRPGAANLKR